MMDSEINILLFILLYNINSRVGNNKKYEKFID